jgi:predicted nucleic acid-binding protein
VARGLTLDTGALIAAERRSEIFRAAWYEAVRRRAPITIPAPVLAQAWRGRNPLIDRLLPACAVQPLLEEDARSIGRLLAESGTRDVIDAMVVIGASARDDAILTSDPDDIARLVKALPSGPRPPIIRT